MKIRHEAILSLNTRVRRLRYMYKAVDIVSESSVSQQLLVAQLLAYGLSQAVYGSISKEAYEPFSGHFFEDASQSYEANITKRGVRGNHNAARVAESYIKLGLSLGLLVQSDQRVSASQLSIPLRFLGNSDQLPQEFKIASRDRYVLALLLRFDRDLTSPLLVELLRSQSGVTIADIESYWDTWSRGWLERLVKVVSERGLGNPSQLLRYVLTSSKARKNPRRYAEHTALIRFHWFIDLGIALGEPIRSPASFVAVRNPFVNLQQLLCDLPSYVVAGDIAHLHFQICKLTTMQSDRLTTTLDFSKLIAEFLTAARTRGMSNIRLSLLDIVWSSVTSAINHLPCTFSAFCDNVDNLLKTTGITIVRAPSREDSYIPTRQ